MILTPLVTDPSAVSDRAPRANAYAERFIWTVRTECLDRLFILNEKHLASALATYVEHYNTERPHRDSISFPLTVRRW